MKTENFEYPDSISSREILDNIFSGLLRDSNERSKTDLIKHYLVKLSCMIDLLEECKKVGKISEMKFKLKDNSILLVECKVLQVSSAFIKIRTIVSKHGDSINGSTTEKDLFYVGEESLLIGVSMLNTSVSEVKIFVDN